MAYEMAENEKKASPGQVMCLRAQMKLCADPDCIHQTPHDIRTDDGREHNCTHYQYCKDKRTDTRCNDLFNVKGGAKV